MKFFVETSVIIRAPATEVWRIITDTTLWPEWGPSVAGVRTRDRYIRPGATGYVRTAFGLWLPFRITHFDDKRQWAWRVGHIPATGHRISSISANRCRLTFDVPVFGAPYLIVCAVAARRIRKLAECGIFNLKFYGNTDD